MTQHTKGNWYTGKDGLDFEIFAESENTPSGEISIAMVFDGVDMQEKEGEANARLIAAAPEMFERLKDILKNIKEGNPIRQGACIFAEEDGVESILSKLIEKIESK